MKTLSVVSAFIFVAASASSQETSVTIKETSPSLVVKDHKPRDVEVFKMSSDTTITYAVAFYRTEQDSLRLFQAFYVTDERFDTAYYQWENDTTVAIRLHDSSRGKNKAFTVFGKGPSTGIITD